VALAAIALLAGAAARTRLALRSPPPGRLFDVGGYRLQLHRAGQGAPAVIMDAGLNDFSVQWAEVQARVAGFTTACVYDRAGLGWSDASPRPRTSGVMVDELHALLAAAGVPGPYVLVGHSFGGLNMRLYAHRYPADAAGLVLVDSAHEEQTIRVPALKLAGEAAVAQFRALARISALGLMALSPASIPGRGLHGEALDRYRAVLATTRTFEGAAAETAALEASLAEARAERVTSLGSLPLVVISRGRPEPFPGLSAEENLRYEREWQQMQSELAALSSRGERVTAARSGHYVQLEQPQVVVDAILRVVLAARQRGL
jgi:pimeloyl-ACP methyl ester carboxylesterase